MTDKRDNNMNLKFLDTILERCNFPAEAAGFFRSMARTLTEDGYEKELDGIMKEYLKEIITEYTDDDLGTFAEKTGFSRYSLWLLMLLLASEEIKKKYDKRGVSDKLFYDTFSDMRCKALECMEEKGVWGTFVPDWYGLFTTCRIIKFGPLEFQDEVYTEDEPYTFGGVSVTRGTPIKGIHIPSSGESFNAEARLDAYRKAWEFYRRETGAEMLICECGSWLLFPDFENCFADGSNIKSFRGDFHIRGREVSDKFHDAWRVFGKAHSLPVSEYPEDTSLRRVLKRHILSGGSFGEGKGMLIFDGERLITRNAPSVFTD